MRGHSLVALLISSSALFASGCATEAEWTTWRTRSAHFASGSHLMFSARNREGDDARVTRQDLALAGRESWWGKPVTVTQGEILER